MRATSPESQNPVAGKRKPEAESLISIRSSIISSVRNTLLASPSFPILCAHFLQSKGVNPNLVKTLAERYQKKFGANMSQPQTRNCTHVKVNGVRCGSPALRGERFCYYHQRVIRGVRTPPRARIHPIAVIEDPQSIQFTLMEVINALLRDTIDVRRATLILRALHIAVKNMQNRDYVSLDDRMSDKVKEIPDYPAPEAATEAVDLEAVAPPFPRSVREGGPPSECDLPLTAAYPPARDASAYAQRRYEEEIYGPYAAETTTHIRKGNRLMTVPVATTSANGATNPIPAPVSDGTEAAHVGADAFVRPAERSEASDVPRTEPAITSAPPRKPPASVRHAPDAKVRTNGANNKEAKIEQATIEQATIKEVKTREARPKPPKAKVKRAS
jgi:hypothetical protein